MHIATHKSLAAEYRRRGWKYIAELLELDQDSPFHIEVGLIIETNDDKNVIHVDDTYAYFTAFLREARKEGGEADSTLCLLNQACWEVIQMSEHTELRNIN